MPARRYDPTGPATPIAAAGALGRPKTHALGRRPTRQADRRSSGVSGRLTTIVLILTLVWAGAASWLAFKGRSDAARLAEEQAELKLLHEDRVKALTRRLVGVASHQILEQDGLSGRLADIITRQVELENRQSALVLMADKVTGVAPAAVGAGTGTRSRADDEQSSAAGSSRTRSIPPSTSAKPETPAPAAPSPTPTLRLGPPRSAGTEGPSPGPRSSLDDPRAGQHQSAGARALQGIEGLPIREQFARLEASLNRLEGSQIRYLGSLASAAQGGVSIIRASLASLGLQIQPPAGSEPLPRRPPLPTVAAPNSFQAQLTAAQTELAQLDRWRGLVDVVPVRAPLDSEHTPTSNFGTRKDPFTGATAMHAGIDFRGPIGTPIKAAASGRVVTAEVTGGYGNLVEVDHGNGVVTRYGHLSSFNVTSGQNVSAGTVVGLLGSTGRSTGPHLHYETRLNGTAVDPMRFLQAGSQLFDHPPPITASLQAEDEAAFD